MGGLHTAPTPKSENELETESELVGVVLRTSEALP